jgi:hypothetical protein
MKKLTVISKSLQPTPTPVYDIEVENDHHYIIEDGVISHNSGFVFASSIIVSMTKKKLKAEDAAQLIEAGAKKKTKEIVGVTSAIKCVKTRFSKPFEEVMINIPYSTGMDPYSGLFEMFKNNGTIQQEGAYYSYTNKAGEKTKLYRKDMDAAFFDMIIAEFPSDDDASKGFDFSHKDIELTEENYE